MVAENTSRLNNQGERSFDIFLIDWENSGWLPGFWEFFRASYPLTFQWDEDWSDEDWSWSPELCSGMAR